MAGCLDTKYNCGQIVSSSCVPYTGNTLNFPVTADQLSCDANINDVISVVDKYVKKLVDGDNLTSLDKNCLDFNPAIITPAQLHQIEINEICLLKGQYTSLSDQFNNLNIGTEVVTIALPTCLQSGAAPCATGPNQYQFIVLLNLFASKLYNHETRITNLGG